MLQEIWAFIDWGLGLSADNLNVWQMSARAVVIFAIAVVLVRMGDKRFLGKSSAFDVILNIILGSVLSRAINGSAEFFPTIGAGLTMVVLHWLLAAMAFRSDRLSTLVKGQVRKLVEQGEIQWDAMQTSHISRKDLEEAARAEASLTSLEQVQQAYLERNGEISILKAESDPKVLEVSVADGVQTVRIQLG